VANPHVQPSSPAILFRFLWELSRVPLPIWRLYPLSMPLISMEHSTIFAGSLAVFSCLVQRSSSESTSLSSSILHNQKRWVERILHILCQNIQYNCYSITLSEALKAKMTYKEYFQNFLLVYPLTKGEPAR